MLQPHLSHLEFLEAQITQFNQRIEQLITAQDSSENHQSPLSSSDSDSNEPTETAITLSWNQAVSLADTIPGVAQNTAELLVAEIGTDMSRFSSASPKS